jgi:hypothetical protein
MADGNDTAGSTGAKGASTPAEKPEEKRYDSEYLIEMAANLLDSRGTFVAAALSQSDRKTHTLAQAKELLGKLGKVRTEPYDGVAEPPPEVTESA